MKLLWPHDFNVKECIVNYYRDENVWGWHCGTCHRTNKRGLVDEPAAFNSMLDHASNKRKIRQYKAWRQWWWNQIMTTKDVKFFESLYKQSYVWAENSNWEELMHDIQADEYLRNFVSGGDNAQR